MKNKKFNLKPIFNKSNNQINFSLKKSDLPKSYRKKLPELKGIECSLEDVKFNEKEGFKL